MTAASPVTTASGAEKRMLFSIVMPAFNEEAVIHATLTALAEHLNREDFHYEILVVDDGSSDSTAGVVEEAARHAPRLRCLRNPGPFGFGFAIRHGLDHYLGDAVVIVTADGSDAPKDVAAYFRTIEEGYDCAFGTRFAPGTKVTGYPPLKLLMNRVANRLISFLVDQPYDDFTNGFKCYRRTVIDAIAPFVAGQFNITIELSVKAVLGGFKYGVVPNDWTQRSAGASSFKLLKLLKPYAVTFIYCLAADYLKKVRR